MAEKSYFLTGATGVLGSEVLRKLHSRNIPTFALLRAKNEHHLNERAQALLKKLKIENSGNIEFIKGDISKNYLGMSKYDYDRISAQTNCIFHCAADVRLHLPFHLMKQNTLKGINEILSFAESIKKNQKLERIDYISTVGVSGCDISLLEEALVDSPRGFHNSYEKSKAIGENELRRHVSNGDPIHIFRPSMIVGDHKTGEVMKFQVFYFLVEFLSGRKSLGIVPDLEARSLDLIPVDIAANMILKAIELPSSPGKVFHLCSGPKKSPSLKELSEVIRESYTRFGVATPTLIELPIPFVKKASALHQYLPIIGKHKLTKIYLEILKYLFTDQHFSNVKTLEQLNVNENFIPHPDTYLDKVLTYYLERKRI